MNVFNKLGWVIALCIVVPSCKQENLLVDGKDPDHNIDADLGDVLIEWGTSYSDVVSYMIGFNMDIPSENTLCFTSKGEDKEVAYRFNEGQLCATIVVFAIDNELDPRQILASYEYLGKLDDCEIYVDLKNNTMASVWCEPTDDCIVIGFAPIKSDAFPQLEQILVTTGECVNVGYSSVELQGALEGMEKSVEVGFIYDTTIDLSEHSGNKVSISASGDFSIRLDGLNSETCYYYCAYALVDDVLYQGEIREFVTLERGALLSANCHIISSVGSYSFLTVKGNSSESVGDVASVEVLWESFGTSLTPKVGDLIKSVTYKDGRVRFQTADIFKEGNGVIAVRDANGTILWSWHIWFTDMPQCQVYYNNAGTMMDRNLGATSATPGDVAALGLLYQWGRKDPFLSSSSIATFTSPKSTISWPSMVVSDQDSGTMKFAVENPTTFIGENKVKEDWQYYGDDKSWSSEKTIYDPCPFGWRVPDAGSYNCYDGVWTAAVGQQEFKHVYDEKNNGMNFSGKFGSASNIWYPICGYRSDNYQDVAVGYYWSSTPSSHKACSLVFFPSGSVYPWRPDSRSLGFPVRCVQE